MASPTTIARDASGRSRSRTALPRRVGARSGPHATASSRASRLHRAGYWRRTWSGAPLGRTTRVNIPLRIRVARKASKQPDDATALGLSGDERLFALGTRTLADL